MNLGCVSRHNTIQKHSLVVKKSLVAIPYSSKLGRLLYSLQLRPKIIFLSFVSMDDGDIMDNPQILGLFIGLVVVLVIQMIRLYKAGVKISRYETGRASRESDKLSYKADSQKMRAKHDTLAVMYNGIKKEYDSISDNCLDFAHSQLTAGAYMKSVLKKNKLTQTQFATSVNIPKSVISKIMTGKVTSGADFDLVATILIISREVSK